MTRFDYANVTGRPAGAVVTSLGRVLPGVAQVQRQVAPYAASWRAANLAALAEPGARWIVLGDSMSLGVGASRYDTGWVNQVADALHDDGVDYRVVNLSASGARVSDVLEQQLPAWRGLAPRADDDGRADLVTLLIGSNDLLRKRYRENLPDNFERLVAALPSGAIVASLPNPRPAAQEANQRLRRAAMARDLHVADMRGGRPSTWRGRLVADHFHPNDLGYAAIAAVFLDSIRERERLNAEKTV